MASSTIFEEATESSLTLRERRDLWITWLMQHYLYYYVLLIFLRLYSQSLFFSCDLIVWFSFFVVVVSMINRNVEMKLALHAYLNYNDGLRIHCWKERILLKKLTWIAEGSSRWSPRKSTTKGEGNSSRRKQQQQNRLSGRPHVHSVHRVRERSTALPDCNCPTLCWALGRPIGRPVEEVGRPPGRPTCGCGLRFAGLETCCI